MGFSCHVGDSSRHHPVARYVTPEKALFQKVIIMFTTSSLRKKFSEGLKNNEFYPLFQPTVHSTNKEIYSFESLIRWKHQGKEIPICYFNKILQEDHLGHRILEFVIDESVALHKKLESQGVANNFSVNVSTPSLIFPNAAARLIEIIEKKNIDKSVIKLEILESVNILSDDIIIENIRQLKNYGFEVLLDDFGEGEFFLKNATAIDFDAIKLDRQLCVSAQENFLARKIISSVVEYSQYTNKKVIAEGIETEDQKNLLHDLGVSIFQGYYFARPMTKEALLPWIKTFQRH